MGILRRSLIGGIIATILISLVRADEAGDPKVVAALLREAVGEIHTKAFRTESKAKIYTRALLGLVLEMGPSAQDEVQDLGGMSDAAAESAFLKTLQALAEKPGQRRTLRELAESALQLYCRQHDPYTRYIKADEYKIVQLMNKAGGSGIGMSINEKKGDFLCFPMPGSPALLGGIKPGDKLLSVDGKPVLGKPLEYIAGLIKGAAGTEVSLRVEHDFGRMETLKVTRETLTAPSLVVEKKVSGMILRIRRFNAELIKETRAALANLSAGSTITLDLRGCPGGELAAAVEFVSLFLNKGEPIVIVRPRGTPEEVNVAEGEREFKPAAIILVQDEGTASAAELTIAALIHSKTARAASQGKKTYGKGVTQSRIELRSGGVLYLTTAELVAPQGKSWDGIGLLPSLENEGRVFGE